MYHRRNQSCFLLSCLWHSSLAENLTFLEALKHFIHTYIHKTMGTKSSDLGAYLHVDTGGPTMSHLKASSEKWIPFRPLADSYLFSPVPVYRQTLIQTPKIWSNLTAEEIKKSQTLTCQIYLKSCSETM